MIHKPDPHPPPPPCPRIVVRGRRSTGQAALPIDPDACYLPAQLAAYLQVSEATLQDWRYRGGGPDYLKLKSGKIRYEGRAVLAWKDRLRRRTTSDAPPAPYRDTGALRVVQGEGRR